MTTDLAEMQPWQDAERIRKLADAYHLNNPRKAQFILAYLYTGFQTRAATLCEIDRTNHTWWMRDDEHYRTAWADAKEWTTENLEDEAYRRAYEGNERGVYYKGERVDTYLEQSDLLTIFLLKSRRPEVYRDNVHITGEITTYKEYGFSTDKVFGIGQGEEPDKTDV